MEYPRTDEDWEKLAECIVTKDPGISPEIVGGLTVDATATIFSWYKGEERTKALVIRQYGRDRLIELAKGAGCLEEREELKLGERMIEVPLGRPVPQTYGDWVNLGMDIKEKAGINDFETTAEVNEHLYHIWREDEDPATAQVSKRWLTEKARQMGID